MPAIQQYLKSGKSPEDAYKEFGIRYKSHPDYPNLHIFSYDQLESPRGHPVVLSSRGIILDAAQDWAVVCRPFDRFFNHGEGYAAPLDWDTARAYTKEDGSLASLYYYDGKWHVATKGSPNASGKVVRSGSAFSELPCDFTFAELFWQIWDELGYVLPNETHNTYIFELCSQYNRVVIPHTTNRLALLAVRDVRTGDEHDPHQWGDAYNVVQSHAISSLEGLKATFATLDPLRFEGYVLCDANYNRIKVKHPGYVALHHMKSQTGPKRILEVIRSGESSEFLVHFPEYEEEYQNMVTLYNGLVDHLGGVWDTVSHYPANDQKAFAMALKGATCKHPGTLFQLRNAHLHGNNKVTIRGLLSEMNLDRLFAIVCS